ncbi:MAG: zinc ribbon domain-containing protein [Pirellulaceae bacterium]
MPIKFKCSCGHVLAVPDSFGGKNGKCPKCQKSVKVPTPNASVASSAAGKSAAGKSTAESAVATVSLMDSLLNDAGLKKRKGPLCPKCSADIRPGAVVCTNCGLNFELGEQIAGFDLQSQRPEFDNPFLQEASDNMVRDMDMDLRRDRSSMPWWVIMSYLIGSITLCIAGLVIVDGNFGEPAPEDTFMGGLQRLQVFTVLGMTATVTGLAIVIFAHLSITFFGFTKSLAKGFGCFFLPILFSFPYGILNWTENKAPVKAIMTASMFIGFGVFLIVRGDGFAKILELPPPF